MAKLALDAQGGADELHPRNQLIGRNALEYLNVLEFFLCLLWSGVGGL